MLGHIISSGPQDHRMFLAIITRHPHPRKAPLRLIKSQDVSNPKWNWFWGLKLFLEVIIC